MRNGMIMTGLTMVCAAALAGCGQVQPESAQPSAPQPGATVMMASVDYPVYSSLEEMGSRSKVVVKGSFVKLAKRDTERSFATVTVFGKRPGLMHSMRSSNMKIRMREPAIA